MFDIILFDRRIVMQACPNFYFMRFSKCIVNSINTYNSKNKVVHGYHYRIDLLNISIYMANRQIRYTAFFHISLDSWKII